MRFGERGERSGFRAGTERFERRFRTWARGADGRACTRGPHSGGKIMGNYGDDRSGGGDRWRGQGQGYRDRDPGGGSGGDDRGFIDRAGDELRSWFGDDEAQRRREADQRRWEQERRMTGRRDNDSGRDSGPGSFGGGGFGTGWGNQAGNSWNRERPGERGGYGASGEDDRGGGGRHYARGEREGWFSDSEGGERGRRPGGSGGQSDPYYSEWRRRQIEDLDRDYEEYRREHQSKFEAEFGSWRSKRQGQRQSLGRVTEHMKVVGSDGSPVGTVDKVRGDRIILTKSDAGAGGAHHSVPCSWVESVDDKVMLNKTADEATSEWRSEERSRALFERGDEGSEGPRNLDRAFPGTYERREGGRGD
jgi:hypothetical protein